MEKYSQSLFCFKFLFWDLSDIPHDYTVSYSQLKSHRWCDVLPGMLHLEVDNVHQFLVSDSDFEHKPRCKVRPDSSPCIYWIFSLPYNGLWRDTLNPYKYPVPHQNFCLYLKSIDYSCLIQPILLLLIIRFQVQCSPSFTNWPLACD